jgi:hypothetical protein
LLPTASRQKPPALAGLIPEQPPAKPAAPPNKEGAVSSSDSRELPANSSDTESSDGNDDRVDESSDFDSPLSLFQDVFTYSWAPVDSPLFISDDRRSHFPRLLFALFAAILETALLMTCPDKSFEEVLSFIASSYSTDILNSELPLSERLLTTILLPNLLSTNADRFNADRLNRFRTMFQMQINAAVRLLIRPHLNRVEVICNRFVSAQFDSDTLLHDVNEFFSRVFQSLDFAIPIQDLLIKQFLTDFQYCAINKLLGNPSRFWFSNAMRWNDFLTAIELDLRISVPLLREVVVGVNMAPTISANPEIVKEICPNVTIPVLTFLLMMFAPDDVIKEPINLIKFTEMYDIQAFTTRVVLPEKDVEGCWDIQGLKLESWSLRRFDPQTLEEFRWLAKYG